MAKGLVETSRAIPPKVQGHGVEAKVLKTPGHVGHQGGVQETRHQGEFHLNSGEIFVVADATLPKTPIPKDFFGGFNPTKLFGVYGLAIGDAGSEAGHGRLVPSRKAHLAGEQANFGLRETGLLKRTSNTVVFGRSVARPVVPEIIQDGPVDDITETFPLGQGQKPPKKFLLAEIAAVRGVGGIARVRDLVSLQDEVADPDGQGEGSRLGQLRLRQ
jgi:hypothetical protein